MLVFGNNPNWRGENEWFSHERRRNVQAFGVRSIGFFGSDFKGPIGGRNGQVENGELDRVAGGGNYASSILLVAVHEQRQRSRILYASSAIMWIWNESLLPGVTGPSGCQEECWEQA